MGWENGQPPDDLRVYMGGCYFNAVMPYLEIPKLDSGWGNVNPRVNRSSQAADYIGFRCYLPHFRET